MPSARNEKFNHRGAIGLKGTLIKVNPDRQTQFVQQLTGAQSRLYAYIFSLLPDPDRSQDVLQETNVLLWEKRDEFEPGTNFGAWACRVAQFQVLSHLRDRKRDRLFFSAELIDQLAARADEQSDETDRRQQALRHCMETLSPEHRQIVERRYAPGGSAQALAEQTGRTRRAVDSTLYRIRQTLWECIQRRLGKRKG